MAHTIEWQDVGGDNAIVIAAATDSIGEIRINGQALVQVRTALRGVNAKPIGRGNTAHRIFITVVRAEEATVQDAREYIIEHAAALAAAAFDRVLLEGVEGDLTWQLADASLESHELRRTGRTVVAQYSFIGGEFTSEVAEP